eukprot:GEMP01014971.1.p1 GENE.GEMP01014971.1~~GEMP01014971.1.p1  ORF type:complete len:705 (+),score=197.40 GEMP01014971.1:49-2115(+)
MTTTVAESKPKTPAVEKKQSVDAPPKEVTTTVETPTTKEAAAEKPVVEEAKVEEEPLKKDTRKKLGAASVKLNHADASVNALITPSLITNANFGGWSALTAGVRAAVGIKSGRYVYEVQVHGATNNSKLHVGVSTLKSSLVYPDEHAILIDQEGVSTVEGVRKKYPKIHMHRGDIVSVLVNRESKHKNTVSVYINGQRELTEEGVHMCTIPIPETLQNEILFPHLIFKDITISMNFGPNALKPLPFPTRMLADAAKADVEISRIELPAEPTIIIPLGLDESAKEWVRTFCAENTNYIDLTRDKLRDWVTKSCDGRHTADKVSVFQNPREMCQMFGTLRVPRNYVVPYNALTAAGRKKVLEFFPGFKKVCKVIFTSSDTYIMKEFDQVTFPTAEEGFDSIEYAKPQQECEAALNEWKDMCKKKARIEDLKVGTWFNEEKEKWAKFCIEIRKEKKYPELIAEDWMLVELRHMIHSLLNAFKDDVKDETRPGFASQNLGFYAKMYDAQPISFSKFGCKSIEDLLELVGDVVDGAGGLLMAKYGKDVDPITFLELADGSRQERAHRVDAGDENAALPFSATPAKKELAMKGLKKIADHQPKKAVSRPMAKPAVSLTPNDKAMMPIKRKLKQLGAPVQPRVIVTANPNRVPRAPAMVPVRVGQAHARLQGNKRPREDSGKGSGKGGKQRKLYW